MSTIKKIRDEEYIQEGEVVLDDATKHATLDEITKAIGLIDKLKAEAHARLVAEELEDGEEEDNEVDDDEDEDDGTIVEAYEFRVENGKVIAHVTHGLVD